MKRPKCRLNYDMIRLKKKKQRELYINKDDSSGINKASDIKK